MDDNRIIELYWARNEDAIAQTEEKYGAYLAKIAFNILCDREDSDECVNDTYLRAWNSIPPQKPDLLRLYLGKITRTLSIDRWRRKSAVKRGGSEYVSSLDELAETADGVPSVEDEAEAHRLTDALDAFLAALPEEQRDVFVCRYYFMDSLGGIAETFGSTEGKVKSMLHRLRLSLKTKLIEEGFDV